MAEFESPGRYEEDEGRYEEDEGRYEEDEDRTFANWFFVYNDKKSEDVWKSNRGRYKYRFLNEYSRKRVFDKRTLESRNLRMDAIKKTIDTPFNIDTKA